MVSKIRAAASNLWSELKRRRVVKTTAAYVVVAWVIVEGADVIFPVMMLPDWTLRLLVVSAIMGLPLVIILAWIFDVERKPERVGNSEVSGNDSMDFRDETLTFPVPPNLSTAIASVAVLRFENLSLDEKYRFLADGIASELHSVLEKVHRLRVASRTSSFSLAGTETDVREIARRLNVHFVITGSVECINDRMRLIVELDNADEGVQIWSERYDRDVNDVLSIQHEIAHSIASEFGGARLRDEITMASSLPTNSLDAWSLVQRARSYTLSFTPRKLAEAVPLLRKAISLDVDYAAAHAALASVLSEQVLNGLSENPQSDRKAALESAERACSIVPNDPFVLKMSSVAWAYFGKSERSLGALGQAVTIAPFDFGAWGFMGWPLVETGSQQNIDELHEIMDRILKAAPSHPGAPYWLYHRSVACCFEGRNDLAVDFARQSVRQNARFPWVWMQYANALGITNAKDAAKKAIDHCTRISPRLTPEYYEQMILGMSANSEIADMRLAGLRRLNALSNGSPTSGH